MYYLFLPCGNTFGWGICGRYITLELSKLADVKYCTQQYDRNAAGNELEYHFFQRKLPTAEDIQLLQQGNDRHPVLQGISNHKLEPMFMRVTAPLKVGYTFFESAIVEADVKTAGSYFDVIAAGSSWCASILQEKGCAKAAVVLQGIDPLYFNPAFSNKQLLRDRFVIFSGGKFEYRKGQDLVMRAYKVLQDKYADVLLVTSWYNLWPFSMKTMEMSPYIRFALRSGDYVSGMRQTLQENGLDVNRVLILPPYHQAMVAGIYQNTDIGLFPNRCEGGTNLVMMEYMACGKPVIASFNTGHKDVLTRESALLLEQMRPLAVQQDPGPAAAWEEPNLDELIQQLEWAYQHREELQQLGQCAGQHLTRFTWKHTGEAFYKLLSQT